MTAQRERRGFTLLLVLWALVAATTLVFASSSMEHGQGLASLERRRHLFTYWRLRGCLALIRSAVDESLSDSTRAESERARGWRSLDRSVNVDIARFGCDAVAAPSGMRLGVNVLNTEELQHALVILLSDSSRARALTSALHHWQTPNDVDSTEGTVRDVIANFADPAPRGMPITCPAELALVPGWSQIGVALNHFGSDAEPIPLSHASLAVLRLLPGMSSEAIARIDRLRGAEHAPVHLEDVLGGISQPARDTLSSHMGRLSRLTTAEPSSWLVSLAARGVDSRAPEALVVTLRRDGAGVAVLSEALEWR